MTNTIALPIGLKPVDVPDETDSSTSAQGVARASVEGPLSIEQISGLYQTALKNDSPIALVMGLQTWAGYGAHHIKSATRGCLGITDYEIPASMVNGGTPKMRFTASPAMQRILALWPEDDPNAPLLPIHIESYRLRLRYIAQDAGLPGLSTVGLRNLYSFAGPWYGDILPKRKGTGASKRNQAGAVGDELGAPWSVRLHNLTLDQIAGVKLTPHMIHPLTMFPPYMSERRVRNRS